MTFEFKRLKMLVTHDVIDAAIIDPDYKIGEFLGQAQNNFDLYFAMRDGEDHDAKFYNNFFDKYGISRGPQDFITMQNLSMVEEDGKLRDFAAILSDDPDIRKMAFHPVEVWEYVDLGYDLFNQIEVQKITIVPTITKAWGRVAQDVAVQELITCFYPEDDLPFYNNDKSKENVENLLVQHFTNALMREWRNVEISREKLIGELGGVYAEVEIVEAALDWIEQSALRSLRNG